MTTTIPMVTVLMPVYNGEKFLAEAIDSILTQTFRDFEFLIINDGSQDKSVNFIESKADSRIRLVHNDQNRGLIYTLNRGIKLARGKYIARMDADDISLPTRLEKQVAYMEANPSVGICGSWIQFFDKDSGILKYPCKSEVIKSQLFWSTNFAHPSVVMRTEFLNKFDLQYDVNNLHAEDYGLWVKASHCFDLANLPEVLLKYRISGESVSNKNAQTQLEKTYQIIRNNFISLGYDIADCDFALVKSALASGRMHDIEEILRFEAILNKLKEYNDKVQMHPPNFYNQTLRERLFRVCVKSAKLGSAVVRIFRESPIGGLNNLKLEHRIRLFTKAYFRR